MDYLFPNPLSIFRYVEFDTYINKVNALALTTGLSLKLVGEYKPIESFINQYPKKRSVKLFDSERKIIAKLVVVVFLNNVFSFLPYIERNKVPFIFTLYPGGGFMLNNSESDYKLKKIFESTYFRKVIVTQNVTKRYLLDNSFCQEKEIMFIYGSPSNWETQKFKYKNKIEDKEYFNLCFVAVKYTNKGLDKGYDIFIDVARKLS